MAITIRCKDGKVYELPAELIESYRRLHPTADDEFARMVIWLEMNRAYVAASERGARKFITNWFKKVRAAQPQRVQRGLMADLLTGRANASDFRADNNIVDITPAKRALG